MTCITTVSYNIIWNGASTCYFPANKGLRQGDPLSSLLFVLCMDNLSHMISDRVLANDWKPIFISRDGPTVSHLMFADDLLLFGEATDA